MIIAALIAIEAAAALPAVTVKAPAVTVKAKEDGFRAEAGTFELEQGPAVHAEIEKRAAELCAGKLIKWGEFGSLTELGKNPGSAPPKINGYYQEFRCLTSDRASPVLAPADWKANAADEADVRRTFERYYAKRDAGDFEAALTLFQTNARPESATWPEQMRAFNQNLGPGKRRITAVTWYVNPPSAELPGVYAAVDFVGEFASVHFYCGYIGFYRIGPGSYEIVREEQNIFHRTDDAADPDHLSQMRAAACSGN